jgi:hypothetical protein
MRSQKLQDLRHGMSSPAQTLGSWVRCRLRHGCFSAFILCLCCPVWVASLRKADSPFKDSYWLSVKQRARFIVDFKAHRGLLIPEMQVRWIIASAKWLACLGHHPLPRHNITIIIMRTNSLEQSPRESDSCSATHEVPRPSRSLPCLQQPVTCPYPEQHKSNPYPPLPFLKMHFNIIALSTSMETAVIILEFPVSLQLNLNQIVWVTVAVRTSKLDTYHD